MSIAPAANSTPVHFKPRATLEWNWGCTCDGGLNFRVNCQSFDTQLHPIDFRTTRAWQFFRRLQEQSIALVCLALFVPISIFQLVTFHGWPWYSKEPTGGARLTSSDVLHPTASCTNRTQLERCLRSQDLRGSMPSQRQWMKRAYARRVVAS